LLLKQKLQIEQPPLVGGRPIGYLPVWLRQQLNWRLLTINSNYTGAVIADLKWISRLTFLLPESVMETFSGLTFESVDEILWCDHSNETSSAVRSHGTIYIKHFTK